MKWFNQHNDGERYRMLVAEDEESDLVGYVATGRFRPKQAYDRTVEISVACSPNMVSKGVGARLCTELPDTLSQEDIHRIVAGIAQPNPAFNAPHERFGFRAVGTFTEAGRKFGRYGTLGGWRNRLEKIEVP